MPHALHSPAPNSPSPEHVVDEAFAQAILEHPLLQVGQINENSTKPSWVRLDRIDLHNHVKWRTVPESENYEDVLQKILEWQINHRFTHLDTRPHWRSVILRPPNFNFIDVVFAWDHTAGDGISGKVFHQSFLASLNAQSSAKTIRILKDRSFDVPAHALTPPLEKLLKFPISCGFLLTEGWHTLKPPSLAFDFPYAVTWAPIQHESCTSRLCLVTVKEDALQVILEACRQHRTTLTGLIHALTLVYMATRLSVDEAPAFQTGTPICLRRFIPRSPEKFPGLDMEHTVANSVTYWLYNFDKDILTKVRQLVSNLSASPESELELEATVWSAAAELRQKLSNKLKSPLRNDTLGLTKFVGDWRSFVKDQLKIPRTVSWEVSNLGVIDGEAQKEKDEQSDGEEVTLEHAIFTQSAAVAGPAIIINPFTVKGKGLTMTCVWQVEVIDEQLAKGLTSDLEIWLSRLGDHGRMTFNRDQ